MERQRERISLQARVLVTLGVTIPLSEEAIRRRSPSSRPSTDSPSLPHVGRASKRSVGGGVWRTDLRGLENRVPDALGDAGETVARTDHAAVQLALHGDLAKVLDVDQA